MDALISLLELNPSAANAFGALASAAAAFLALAVSIIAAYISIWAVRSQREHNELSVRPLVEVTVADYEDSLRVKLCNNGTGPMIITKIEVLNGSSAKHSIIEWMPDLPEGRFWTSFSGDIRARSLRPGCEIALLELTEAEEEKAFARSRSEVRKALAPLIVKVEYTDIYNKLMPIRIKDLSWFGRHFVT
ncbi:MAG: hypothetical protein AB2697_21685 [Candidatus Thiodiazotropha endolucinida]